MLIPIVSVYVLAILFVLLRITWKYEPKYKLVNEAGVPKRITQVCTFSCKVVGIKRYSNNYKI